MNNYEKANEKAKEMYNDFIKDEKAKIIYYRQDGSEIEQFKKDDGSIYIKEIPYAIGSNKPDYIKSIQYNGTELLKPSIWDLCGPNQEIPKNTKKRTPYEKLQDVIDNL